MPFDPKSLIAPLREQLMVTVEKADVTRGMLEHLCDNDTDARHQKLMDTLLDAERRGESPEVIAKLRDRVAGELAGTWAERFERDDPGKGRGGIG